MSGFFSGAADGPAYAFIEWMGADFEAEIAFDVTEWGSPPIIDYVNGGDPGVDPEWDIGAIVLREDRGDGDLGPAFETTGALFRVLVNSEKINDAVLASIEDEATERRFRRYSRQRRFA